MLSLADLPENKYKSRDELCKLRELHRRWNWSGHILRREGVTDCFTTMCFTPIGQSRTRRLKATWRRTGWKSWNVARVAV